MKHKAYLDFMNNVAKNLEKRVEDVVQHGVDVLRKDNPKQQDVDLVWDEIRNLHKDVGSDAADAAQGEIKERVLDYHQSLGLTEQAAESKFRDVFDLTEKARRATPIVIARTRALWIKVIAAVSAGVAVVAVSMSVHTGGRSTVTPDSPRASSTNSQVQEAPPTFDPSPTLRDFVETSNFDPQPNLVSFVEISDTQMGEFVRSIAHPVVPLSDSVISELPEAVAKTKDEPVSVSVNGHTYPHWVFR
jgi:hypothetical protein